MPLSEHGPRVLFDTLFTDPRHYRGDCRLMRTAVRCGWLSDAPQADREALLARFEEASADRREGDPNGVSIRTTLAECRTLLAMDRVNLSARVRALRYWWGGDYSTGRPRERWRVLDFPNRIDANELRRRAKAEGVDLSTLRAIDVRPADSPETSRERIALAVVPDARYGWRVWLVCPRCKNRRTHLYPVQAGVRCRKCAGIGHGR